MEAFKSFLHYKNSIKNLATDFVNIVLYTDTPPLTTVLSVTSELPTNRAVYIPAVAIETSR